MALITHQPQGCLKWSSTIHIQLSESSPLINFYPWWFTSIPIKHLCPHTLWQERQKAHFRRPKVQDFTAVRCNIGIFLFTLGYLSSNCIFVVVEHLLDEFYGLILHKALDSASQGLSRPWKPAAAPLKKALIAHSEVLIRDLAEMFAVWTSRLWASEHNFETGPVLGGKLDQVSPKVLSNENCSLFLWLFLHSTAHAEIYDGRSI